MDYGMFNNQLQNSKNKIKNQRDEDMKYEVDLYKAKLKAENEMITKCDRGRLNLSLDTSTPIININLNIDLDAHSALDKIGELVKSLKSLS